MRVSIIKKITVPFVVHGIFENEEQVLEHLAEDYISRRMEEYRDCISSLKAKYGASLAEFEQQGRRICVKKGLIPALSHLESGQQVMQAEDDLEDWHAADQMLNRWPKIQADLQDAEKN